MTSQRSTAGTDAGGTDESARAPIERRKQDLDARLLRTFVTIVDLRSFTRAGRRLGLSQSAISQQLGSQERMLGVKLLVRAGKGVPRIDGRGRGALHVLVQVDVPKRVSAKAKALLQELQKELKN
jgi:DNA-binding transcriptional ArsR family regulator